jgi:lipopolysaccharide export LptBFGC system permease protein LptF
MEKLFAQLAAFEPATDGQRILHAEALRAYNQLLQQRRQRLDAVQGGLPGVLWLLLIPGALACIAMSTFFRLDNVRFQAVLLLGVSIALAMVVFVVVALDRPFTGDMAVTADSYRLVYDHHMKISPRDYR